MNQKVDSFSIGSSKIHWRKQYCILYVLPYSPIETSVSCKYPGDNIWILTYSAAIGSSQIIVWTDPSNPGPGKLPHLSFESILAPKNAKNAIFTTYFQKIKKRKYWCMYRFYRLHMIWNQISLSPQMFLKFFGDSGRISVINDLILFFREIIRHWH